MKKIIVIIGLIFIVIGIIIYFAFIVELYGEEAANLRVEYESNFEDVIYKNSWHKALSFTFKERQLMLKEIVKECSSEEK